MRFIEEEYEVDSDEVSPERYAEMAIAAGFEGDGYEVCSFEYNQEEEYPEDHIINLCGWEFELQEILNILRDADDDWMSEDEEEDEDENEDSSGDLEDW